MFDSGASTRKFPISEIKSGARWILRPGQSKPFCVRACGRVVHPMVNVNVSGQSMEEESLYSVALEASLGNSVYDLIDFVCRDATADLRANVGSVG